MSNQENYEMFWDCPSCHTKKLLGVTHRHCPNCGHYQEENLRYFPEENEKIALKDHIYHGVDWDCKYCSTPNSNIANFCTNCGAGKDGTAPVKLIDNHKKSNNKNISPNQHTNHITPSSNNLGSNKQDNSSMKYLFIGIPLFLILVFIILFFIKNDEKLQISSKTWERKISVERFSKLSGSEWCNSVPYNAYDITKHKEVRTYNKIPDGETCSYHNQDRGDGSYAKVKRCTTNYRSEPVYDYKCNYHYNDWKHNRYLTTSGNEQKTPYWADVSKFETKSNLNSGITISVTNQFSIGNGVNLGKERLGKREEKYEVNFLEPKESETYSCSFDYNKWNVFQIGKETEGKIRLIGTLDCDSLNMENK